MAHKIDDAVKQVCELLLFKVQSGEVACMADAMEFFMLHLESHDDSFHR